MEAHTSLNENQKILETLSVDNKNYKLEIISNNSELIIKIYSNDVEDCDLSYEMKFKLNELYNLNKYFRQFDTIDEVFKALENNAKMLKEKCNIKVYELNFESVNLCLKITLFFMSGNTQSITILMNKIKIDEKEVIDKLKSHIKYIKNIPGVKELIFEYENKQAMQTYNRLKTELEQNNIFSLKGLKREIISLTKLISDDYSAFISGDASKQISDPMKLAKTIEATELKFPRLSTIQRESYKDDIIKILNTNNIKLIDLRDDNKKESILKKIQLAFKTYDPLLLTIGTKDIRKAFYTIAISWPNGEVSLKPELNQK